MYRASVHLPLSTPDFDYNVHIWMLYNSINMKDMNTLERTQSHHLALTTSKKP